MSPRTLLLIGCALGCLGLFGVIGIFVVQEWMTRQRTLRWRHTMKRREW